MMPLPLPSATIRTAVSLPLRRVPAIWWRRGEAAPIRSKGCQSA